MSAWEHRRLRRSVASVLRMREVASSVAEAFVGILEVERNRKMNAGSDAATLECSLDGTAVVDVDDEEVVDALVGRVVLWQIGIRLGQEIPIQDSKFLASGGPPVEPLELDPQHGTLEAVHAVVESHRAVVVALLRAVVAQRPGELGDRVVVRRESPALSVGSQILCWVEAERRSEAECTYARAPVSGTVRLARVFDHRKAVPPRDVEDRIENNPAVVGGWMQERSRGSSR